MDYKERKMATKKFILNEIDIVYKPIEGLISRPIITTPDDAHSLFFGKTGIP
jgi:hypothetical protein